MTEAEALREMQQKLSDALALEDKERAAREADERRRAELEARVQQLEVPPPPRPCFVAVSEPLTPPVAQAERLERASAALLNERHEQLRLEQLAALERTRKAELEKWRSERMTANRRKWNSNAVKMPWDD